jgi:hypothetical protein
MTDELIESVARAICESKPDRAGFWETTPEPRRKGYRTQARAAVVAVLKELELGWVVDDDPDLPRFYDYFIAIKAQIEGEQ